MLQPIKTPTILGLYPCTYQPISTLSKRRQEYLCGPVKNSTSISNPLRIRIKALQIRSHRSPPVIERTIIPLCTQTYRVTKHFFYLYFFLNLEFARTGLVNTRETRAACGSHYAAAGPRARHAPVLITPVLPTLLFPPRVYYSGFSFFTRVIGSRGISRSRLICDSININMLFKGFRG